MDVTKPFQPPLTPTLTAPLLCFYHLTMHTHTCFFLCDPSSPTFLKCFLQLYSLSLAPTPASLAVIYSSQLPSLTHSPGHASRLPFPHPLTLPASASFHYFFCLALGPKPVPSDACPCHRGIPQHGPFHSPTVLQAPAEEMPVFYLAGILKKNSNRLWDFFASKLLKYLALISVTLCHRFHSHWCYCVLSFSWWWGSISPCLV